MDIQLVLWVVALSVFVTLGSAETLIVGQNQGGWTLGVKYGTLNAAIGDSLSFTYRPGVHDVWRIPSSKCDFDAPGAELVGPPADGSTEVPLTEPGTYYFACSFTGHCDGGQILVVEVGDGPTGEASPEPERPGGDTDTSVGQCSAPEQVDTATGEVKVSCRSPTIKLAPGDNIYPNILLPNPYPDSATAPEIVLRTVSAEVVDETGRPVPLSEVYLHHVFGDIRFVPAEGAEVRRSPMRQPLPAPYFLRVDTAIAAEEKSRYANVHVIQTTGVSPDALKACIECWCRGITPPIGSIGCCAKCPTNSTEAPKPYYLEFNVTYIVPTAPIVEDSSIKEAHAVILDVRGGLEYSIQPAPQTNSTNGTIPISTFTRQLALDYFCPQQRNFSVVKCWGHQHIGAKCISMVDATSGTTICNSCPEYGTEPGVAGNEEGYVVGMGATLLDPPYIVQPGQEVVLSASYAADQPYAGVMSLLPLVLADFDAREECNINYAGFIQPPRENAFNISVPDAGNSPAPVPPPATSSPPPSLLPLSSAFPRASPSQIFYTFVTILFSLTIFIV